MRFVEDLGQFCDGPARDDVRAFLTAHPLPNASRALDQTLERINGCVAFRATGTAALSEWAGAR